MHGARRGEGRGGPVTAAVPPTRCALAPSRAWLPSREVATADQGSQTPLCQPARSSMAVGGVNERTVRRVEPDRRVASFAIVRESTRSSRRLEEWPIPSSPGASRSEVRPSRARATRPPAGSGPAQVPYRPTRATRVMLCRRFRPASAPRTLEPTRLLTVLPLRERARVTASARPSSVTRGSRPAAFYCVRGSFRPRPHLHLVRLFSTRTESNRLDASTAFPGHYAMAGRDRLPAPLPTL